MSVTISESGGLDRALETESTIWDELSDEALVLMEHPLPNDL